MPGYSRTLLKPNGLKRKTVEEIARERERDEIAEEKGRTRERSGSGSKEQSGVFFFRWGSGREGGFWAFMIGDVTMTWWIYPALTHFSDRYTMIQMINYQTQRHILQSLRTPDKSWLLPLCYPCLLSRASVLLYDAL